MATCRMFEKGRTAHNFAQKADPKLGPPDGPSCTSASRLFKTRSSFLFFYSLGRDLGRESCLRAKVVVARMTDSVDR